MNYRFTPPGRSQERPPAESVTIIPAAPGTRLLTPDDGFADFWETAVIAWRVVTSDRPDPRTGQAGAIVSVEPVTVDSDGFDLPDGHAIRHPGFEHVEVPGICAYESATVWLADLRARTTPRTAP
ncbi:MAG: hypothetical protein RL456_625 [Pseudomonadota bacterium]|jgi:hypothetical protein